MKNKLRLVSMITICSMLFIQNVNAAVTSSTVTSAIETYLKEYIESNSEELKESYYDEYGTKEIIGDGSVSKETTGDKTVYTISFSKSLADYECDPDADSCVGSGVMLETLDVITITLGDTIVVEIDDQNYLSETELMHTAIMGYLYNFSSKTGYSTAFSTLTSLKNGTVDYQDNNIKLYGSSSYFNNLSTYGLKMVSTSKVQITNSDDFFNTLLSIAGDDVTDNPQTGTQRNIFQFIILLLPVVLVLKNVNKKQLV
ncbi:MAG: hypothetical protein R3Y13_00480 [bacterium]